MDTDDRDHFKKLTAQLPQRIGSSPQPSGASSRLGRDPEHPLLRARMILGCYRRDDAADPETYVAAIAAVLAQYPVSVMDYVSDPRTGIAAKKTFLPSVAEVTEACEDRAKNEERGSTYEKRVEEQLRLRDEWKKPLSPEERERRQRSAQSWLDRTDPRAQALSGQKPKGVVTEDERAALLEDARRVGASIKGMKLLDETRAIIREQGERT